MGDLLPPEAVVVVDRLQFAIKAAFIGGCLGFGVGLAVSPSPASAAVVGLTTAVVIAVGLYRLLVLDRRVEARSRPASVRGTDRVAAADGSGERDG